MQCRGKILSLVQLPGHTLTLSFREFPPLGTSLSSHVKLLRMTHPTLQALCELERWDRKPLAVASHITDAQ